MRTDPRAACANSTESFWWAILHDLVAHPLMAFTAYSKVSLRFHDWTSHYAWPRVTAHPRTVRTVMSKFGMVTATEIGAGVYSVQHPRVMHAFVTNALGPDHAISKSIDWFTILADEFGGVFEAGRHG